MLKGNNELGHLGDRPPMDIAADSAVIDAVYRRVKAPIMERVADLSTTPIDEVRHLVIRWRYW